MITIAKVRNADYYLSELQHDDAYEYYGSLERSGRWHGTLAAELGLDSMVDPDDFRAVLEGIRPDTGTSLTEFPISVRALDVTLSVPKSMSVVWAVGDADARHNVERAIDRAEAAVVEILEAEATIVRRGHGGLNYHDGAGLIVASFDHRTSRLGDPNLHRHLVIANASRGPDDRITGIDTRQLYNIRYTAESVFQAVLRDELAQSHGLLFTEIDRHGVGEISGVPLPVRREFSQRRRDIEAEMADRGTTTGRGARIAALATRPTKEPDLPDDVLRRQWRDRARALDFDVASVPTVVRTPSLTATDEQLALLVTEHDATYNRRDVIRAVARSADNGASLEQIIARTGHYLDGHQAIERVPGIFTTPEILQLETRAAALAVEGQATGIGIASAVAVETALAERPHLADEQRHMVERITTSGDAINVVVGQAGAGKTTAADALRAAYETDGHRIIGTALSARAAAELQAGAGIPCQTIHRTLTQIATGRLDLDASTVLIVDEAGMVGTRQLAQLIEEAHQARAKLVLIGDPRQLPEIDAGGTFSAIGHRIEPLRLTQNRRQLDPNERAALAALRDNDVDQALTRLHRSGRLTLADNSDNLREVLVADWQASITAGDNAVMIAPQRSDVADLNERARAHLRHAGHLGDAVWRNDSTDYAIGDRVMAHRNRYDLGLLNGSRGTVTAATRKSLTVHLDDGKAIDVPNQYINDGHLSHGYAFTVHKAQGMTCDSTYLLGDDGLFNELGYTGLSRGRQENHLYSVTSRDELGHAAADPLIDLRFALGTSRAKTAAIDIGGPDLG